MLPTPDQIRNAAYDRWQRRGGGHGRDRDDWIRAEQNLLFALNYTVVTQVRANPAAADSGNGAARGNEPGGRVCRFCEQAAPRARFNPAAGPGLSWRGDGSLALMVPDECDECRQLFEESIESDVDSFASPIWAGWSPGDPLPAILATRPVPQARSRARSPGCRFPASMRPCAQGPSMYRAT